MSATKNVLLLTSSPQSEAALSTRLPYLRMIPGFLGMTDVETISREGIASDPEAAEQALTDDRARAAALTLSLVG